MTNEEYVRRVVRIQERIERMFPDPPGDWDSNQYEHERVYYARKRARERIYSLPARWRKLPARRSGCYCSNTLGPRAEHQRCASCPMRGLPSA